MAKISKKSISKKIKKNTYQISWVHISVLMTAIVVCLLVKKFSATPFLSNSYAQQTLICPTPVPGQQSLQLQPCYPPSPSVAAAPPINAAASTTTTGNFCASDAVVVANSCSCLPYDDLDFVCVDPNCDADGGESANGFGLDSVAGLPAGSNCVFGEGDKNPPAGASCVQECNSKPIIYLYPTKTTLVDVSLNIPGIVTVSDPLYPVGGWKNIEAHSDGSLVYNNKKYHELYYESATIKANAPTTGFIIKKSDLKPELTVFAAKLGLIGNEQQEFLDYWIPRLDKLNTPYLFISILTPQEKEKVDHVDISPKPDTSIEFLAYFKPVQKPYEVEPLVFPTVPKRDGFVEVEWGGTVDE